MRLEALRGNVVPMPGGAIDQAPLAPTADVSPADRWKGITDAGTPLAQGLDAIVAQDVTQPPQLLHDVVSCTHNDSR